VGGGGRQIVKGWGYISVVEHFPSKYEAQESIPAMQTSKHKKLTYMEKNAATENSWSRWY
jgi:hypothetical protein